jgi:arylsulfatase A-like enzyme
MIDSICGIVSGESLKTDNFKKSFPVLMDLLLMPPEDNFFIVHWIIDPHIPFRPIDKFKSRIMVDQSKLSKNPKLYETAHGKQQDYNEDEKKYILDLYKAEVAAVDERIGFTIKMLKHTNLLDNTYVVFTSDHGELFGEHDFYGHAIYFYEGLIKVPLIIAGPGLEKGKRIQSRVSNLDLMPTMKELLHVEYEDSMQGRSYLPLLFGMSWREEYLFFDDVREHEQIDALIEDGFKLICLKDQKFELYDLSKDPSEQHNLAPEHPQRVEAMHHKIMAIRKINASRRDQNIAAIADNINKRSSREQQILLQRLKSLGYVQ